MKLTKIEDLEKKYAKLLIVEHDFICEKGVTVTIEYKCKKCDYFYYDEDRFPRCLKRAIRDWALHRIDRGK